MQQRHGFPGLDALRGVAAACVVLFHLTQAARTPVLTSAHLAVDLFFALSGFVVAHAYGAKLGGRLSFGAFARVRAVRLWPLHLLGVAVGLLYFAAASARSLGWPVVAGSGALHALMLPTPPGWIGQDTLFPFNVAVWSLFYEVLVNFGWAAAVLLGARRLGPAGLWLAVAAGAVWLTVESLRFGTVGVGWTWPTLGGGIARVVTSFSLGLLLHRWWAAGRIAAVTDGRLLLTAACLLLVLELTPLHGGVWGELLCVLLVAPLLVAAGVAATVKGRWAAVSGWLGTISYPLYVLHLPVSYFVERWWWKATGDAPPDARWPLVLTQFAAIVLVSQLAASLYDKPLRAWLSRRRAPAPVAAQA